ncbi:Ig-like domain-containing protein [Curtobacterium sp. MCSS17_008]|uniref:Ig-like domain-containing protein n=1 Tax=Curtobacterium sp. MCSS17_008 TaxID=2175647 RepID=UPI0011B522B5|nr:Ig-like domain-containing protein [Curtobacterium sp. MCSS17_008]
MRFSNILAAASTVGIAGVLAIGAATPAHATSAASADRVFGPMYSWNYSASSTPLSWVGWYVQDDQHVRGRNASSEAEAASKADTFELPSTGSTGPLVAKSGAGAGKCLTIIAFSGANPDTKGEGVMQPCDPSNASQQFFWREANTDGTGYGWTLRGHLNGKEVAANGAAWVAANAVAFIDTFPQIETYPAVVADLTAQVDSVDSTAKSAVVSGTGEPGAAIDVKGPSGTVSTTVKSDGTWHVTVPGLAVGDNDLKVTQTVGDNVQTKDLVATILASPVVDPMIAGGAGVAAIALLGAAMVRRNRQNA